MKNEIILGSANFDQVYGVKKNFIGKKEIKKLLNFAKKNKIKTIDTSPLYNKSEKIIGSLNKSRFGIISKIPKIPKNIKDRDIKTWVKQCVIKSLKNLQLKKYECLLIHDANSLLKKNGNEIYKIIEEMKKDKIAQKIGISIYDFNTLGKILRKFKFDLIQAPLNIFDQRLIKKGWLKKLKEKKIEVHARSIFLQGTLLLKHNQLPKKLKRYKKIWKTWEIWLKKNELQPLEACLRFIFNHSKLDGVVVGSDNKNQLNQIIKLKKLKKNFSVSKLSIDNTKIIDPRKWIY